MEKVVEFLKLFGLQMQVLVRNFWDYLQTAAQFYSNFRFCKIDHYLIFSYLFNSPFSISKRFLMQRGDEEVYAYGETPLVTMAMIAEKCGIGSADTVFELGSGRGRTCFWMNQILGCKVVGIEMIPEFVKRANQVKQKFGVTGVTFRNEDMLESDFTGGTLFYLYGTSFADDLLRKLAQKITKLPSGTKVVTVSYPITDYASARDFEVMRKFPAAFTWGVADVYLQIRK